MESIFNGQERKGVWGGAIALKGLIYLNFDRLWRVKIGEVVSYAMSFTGV